MKKISLTEENVYSILKTLEKNEPMQTETTKLFLIYELEKVNSEYTKYFKK